MLTVRLYSFGYQKSGVPEDNTPNKGGFVFDCRFIKNPRWEPSLQELNGKDGAVIDFLDSDKPMQEMLVNVEQILCNAIENYLSRDFTSLMVSFGCTGGQHRSIYAVEKVRQFLVRNFNGKIKVSVTHTEYPELSS